MSNRLNPRDSSLRPRSRSGTLLASIALAAVFAGSPPAAAQTNADALQNLRGQNDAQNDMANSIDKVCPTLVANQAKLSGDTKDLQQVCTSMVQTANGILDNGSPSGQSLGITTSQTNDALQTINGEELQNPQQQITEIRDTMISGLTARIDAIRTGTVGPGLSLAGLGLGDGDQLLAAEDLTDAEILPAQWSESPFLSKLGIFANGKVIIGDKDDTNQSDGYDFQTFGLNVGADYRVTDEIVLGGAFGYSHYTADINNTARSPNGQDVDSDTYAFSLFGAYNFDFGAFVDVIGTVGWADFDSKRKIFIPNNNDSNVFGGDDINRTAKGSFDTFQYGFAARAGYDYSPEALKALTLTPIAGIEFLRADIDSFEEKGAQGLNLEYDDYTAKSTTSNLGLEASYAFSTGIGVITPAVRGRWVHEFEDDNGPKVRYLNDPTGLSEFRITADSTDSDYGVLGASVSGQFAAGWAAYIDYAAPVGLSDFTVNQIFFGVRKDF
jgi:outer membrane lipase/esterase